MREVEMKLKDIQVVNGLLFALDVEGQLWMRDTLGKWHEEPGPRAVVPDNVAGRIAQHRAALDKANEGPWMP